MSRYPLFDRSRIHLTPLAERDHDLDLSTFLPLPESIPSGPDTVFDSLAKLMLQARTKKASRILMMGAHVIRSGVQNFILDLMTRGWITLLAGNGACAIHDWELAHIGATTESVARYIRDGRFGMWEQTGELNTVIATGATQHQGIGEAVGQTIWKNIKRFPYRKTSLYGQAWHLGIPFTTHVGIGQDIIHQHPSCDGAALGHSSYIDFLIYAAQIEKLEGGVVMAFGSSVMAPEVYLKALSMARNVAEQNGRQLRDFSTLVCDLQTLPQNLNAEPPKSSPQYYFRPYKTMLVRTVADGGRSHYVQGPHRETIPRLWAACRRIESRGGQ